MRLDTPCILSSIAVGIHGAFASAVAEINGLAQKNVQQIVTNESPVTIASFVVQCTRQQDLIKTELKYAIDMVSKIKDSFTPDNQFVKVFWPNAPPEVWSEYTNEKWLTAAKKFLQNLRQRMLVDAAGSISITCNQDDLCVDTKRGLDVDAHTDWETNTINLCDKWFTQKSSADIACVDKTLLDRYETKALTIVHEVTHLNTDPFGPTSDIEAEYGGRTLYAYGVSMCEKLAGNKFPDARNPIPEKPSTDAPNNADNWAWIAAGTYWLDYCKTLKGPDFKIPIDYGENINLREANGGEL